jgi:hypothetical protein
MYQKALCSLEVGNAPAGNQSASLIRMALISPRGSVRKIPLECIFIFF